MPLRSMPLPRAALRQGRSRNSSDPEKAEGMSRTLPRTELAQQSNKRRERDYGCHANTRRRTTWGVERRARPLCACARASAALAAATRGHASRGTGAHPLCLTTPHHDDPAGPPPPAQPPPGPQAASCHSLQSQRIPSWCPPNEEGCPDASRGVSGCLGMRMHINMYGLKKSKREPGRGPARACVLQV